MSERKLPERRHRRSLQWWLFACVLASGAVAGIRYWPRPTLASRIASSIAVFDSQDRLLRLTLASDDQYRIWTPLEKISPELVDALLLHEDRNFYAHFGVNPIALLRAGARTYSGGVRQGGSTLTMQLARLVYGLNTRTIGGKCKQIFLSIGLELRYSKHDILEAHLNLMPYGANIQGVGAASLIYFGKHADRLVLNEALSLVVIPQSPSRRGPNGDEPNGLRAARERLFKRWVLAHPRAASEAEHMALPLKFSGIDQLPFIAPHFTSAILAKRAGANEIHSTLDAPLQRLAEQIVGGYVREQARIGIRNAAALLIDTRDLSVRAMIGSADFFSSEIEGQVNGTLAKRSPGSALKPFIYALAIDQGLIHPLTVLKDAPTNFGGFSPENFDGRFAGPISATEALTRSRNIPAVMLSARLATPGFHQFLRSAGISKLASESHYGLSLALGGGEVTMEELAILYAMLANHGVIAPLRYLQSDAQSDGPRLLSEEASFMTLDMLASAPRPEANQWSNVAQTRVAWKTGTSWGFRDAWTVGVFGDYVLAVWVGNFDGSSNPAFVGVQAAAPLFFRIVDAVNSRFPRMPDGFALAPPRLVQIEVCSASGDLPNADCPRTARTWYWPGVSPIKVSQVHRKIWIDTRTGKIACRPLDPATSRPEVFEFWPSDLTALFAEAGMPRRKPPPAGDCPKGSEERPESSLGSSGSPPQIASPVANVTYSLNARRADSDFVLLNASVEGDVRQIHWFADDSYIGTARASEAFAWRPTTGGRHLVRAIDDRGRADTREVQVAFRE